VQGSSRVDFCLKSCHQHTEEVLALLEQFRSRLRLYVIKQPSAMVLKIYQQVLKISFMLGFLINVTKQKLLMEEMGTEFDVMCRDKRDMWF
jgi:hypothetical protein